MEHFARAPQVQERLTTQLAGWLSEHLGAHGVGVVLRAEHTCMTVRGVRAVGSTTVTSALHSCLRRDPGGSGRVLRAGRRDRLTADRLSRRSP